MKRIKLVWQLNLIFLLVMAITVVVLVLVFNVSIERGTSLENIEQLRQDYRAKLNYIHQNNFDENKELSATEYNGFLFEKLTKEEVINLDTQKVLTHKSLNTKVPNSKPIISETRLQDMRNSFWKEYLEKNLKGVTAISILSSKEGEEDILFEGTVFSVDDNTKILLLTFTDDRYGQHTRNNNYRIYLLAFFILSLSSSVVFYVYFSFVINRIRTLKMNILNLPASHYENEIKVSGNDEISELAQAIEKMRVEIKEEDKNKINIIQNISHDIKTPLTVIQSYAEAIKDGISTPEDLDIIIKQVDTLKARLGQLIKFNKTEYIDKGEKATFIKVADVVNEVVERYQFKFNGKFILNLDNSRYKILRDQLEIVLSNVIENGIRYAKTKIEITLNKETLTISNDGEKIPPHLISKIFEPYEKGDKGQFGLGLSITKQILSHYRYSIEVENLIQGVRFKITPFEVS